jgi:hypothetical protein
VKGGALKISHLEGVRAKKRAKKKRNPSGEGRGDIKITLYGGACWCGKPFRSLPSCSWGEGEWRHEKQVSGLGRGAYAITLFLQQESEMACGKSDNYFVTPYFAG